MMIPADRTAPHIVDCRSVIHIGAHVGQEAAQYSVWGIGAVTWIEANPALIPELTANVPAAHTVIEACPAAVAGEHRTLHIADEANGRNHGQSSSLLELGTHALAHPEVHYVDHVDVITTTVDDIVAEHGAGPSPHLLNIDTQGTELDILTGAPQTVADTAAMILEINVDELYRGCGRFPDLDAFLFDAGFEVEDVVLNGCQMRDCADGGNRWVGWGDIVARRVPNPRRFADIYPELWGSWYP